MLNVKSLVNLSDEELGKALSKINKDYKIINILYSIDSWEENANESVKVIYSKKYNNSN